MKYLQLVGWGLAFGLAACTNADGLVVPMPDADLGGRAANPEGAAYPSTNIGGQPRTAGRPGQTFPNLTLAGIASIASIDEPAVVSLADYYDPTGSRYDLLHVIGIFLWCPHCNNETNGLMQISAWRAEHRVAVIQIAMEGYGGWVPGWNELQRWVRDHGTDFPVVVDGEGAALGEYFAVGSVPLNIVVAPRTMEILGVDVGEVGDVEAYEAAFLNGR